MDTIVRNRSIAVVVAVVVVAVVVVGLVAVLGSSPDADPGTPEAAAQSYFRALADHDVTAADAVLTSGVVDECPDRHRQYLEAAERLEVAIVDVDEVGETATVVVSITETYGDNPLFLDRSTFDEVLTMEHIGDRWLITRPPWPLHCTEG